ncbi:hypothetical protein GF386_02075 [Candidatus Pacearchaeota archaeon]|nr:hypothetical protein [Candidatus Pacearchaeota archaeon]
MKKSRKVSKKKDNSVIMLLVGIFLFLVGIILINFSSLFAWVLIIISSVIIIREMFMIRKFNKK